MEKLDRVLANLQPVGPTCKHRLSGQRWVRVLSLSFVVRGWLCASQFGCSEFVVDGVRMVVSLLSVCKHENPTASSSRFTVGRHRNVRMNGFFVLCIFSNLVATLRTTYVQTSSFDCWLNLSADNTNTLYIDNEAHVFIGMSGD